MKAPLQKTNRNNTPLKCIALVIGYTFWYIFGSSHTTTVQLSVPLCFYNLAAYHTISAPESILVKIAGKRSDIRAVAVDQLAVHIDAEELHDGRNLITITHHNLLLPECIKLVHYVPSNPTVELLQTKQIQET